MQARRGGAPRPSRVLGDPFYSFPQSAVGVAAQAPATGRAPVGELVRKPQAEAADATGLLHAKSGDRPTRANSTTAMGEKKKSAMVLKATVGTVLAAEASRGLEQ